MSNTYIKELPTLALLHALKDAERRDGRKAARAALLAAAAALERPARLIVLDTNVLMDIWVFANPASLALLAAIRDGRAAAVRSEETDEEFADVLSRKAFALTAGRQAEILQEWIALSCPFEPDPESLPGEARCRDGDDQKFLHLAAAARADILVSRDKLVLKAGRKAARSGVHVLTPEQAVAALQS